MIQRLAKLAYRLSRKRERATKYDGALSYAGEFHALAMGLAAGLAAAVTWRPEIFAAVALATLGFQGLGKAAETALRRVGKAGEKATALGELRREPWYALGGDVVAFVGGTVVMHGPARLADVVGALA